MIPSASVSAPWPRLVVYTEADFTHIYLLFIFHILYMHTFIQLQFIHPSPVAEASLHFFIACMLSGEDLPVVPSQESNSGLPYSKPTRSQLSHAAP
jgi:hypothetical protein